MSFLKQKPFEPSQNERSGQIYHSHFIFFLSGHRNTRTRVSFRRFQTEYFVIISIRYIKVLFSIFLYSVGLTSATFYVSLFPTFEDSLYSRILMNNIEFSWKLNALFFCIITVLLRIIFLPFRVLQPVSEHLLFLNISLWGSKNKKLKNFEGNHFAPFKCCLYYANCPKISTQFRLEMKILDLLGGCSKNTNSSNT